MDFTPAEIVSIASGMTAVATIALKIAWDAVRARRVKNGHSDPTRAAVQPKDALWFATTQSKILRVCNRIAKRVGVEGEHESDFD